MSAEEKILEVIKSEEKHKRYNQAVQNSTRRKVLGFLADGEKSFSELLISTQMVQRALEYQLDFLKYGGCITKEGENHYKITPEKMF